MQFCYVNFTQPLIVVLTHLSRVIRKPAFGVVRPGKTQIGHSFLSYNLGNSDIFNFVYYAYPQDSEQKKKKKKKKIDGRMRLLI